MDFQVEKLNTIQRKLNFTVPSQTVTSELDKAFKNMAKRANLAGFRRGKVPRKVLEQRFGRSIRGEVAANLINTSFRQASTDMEFFGQPAVDQGDLKRGEDFAFSIVVEVKPELELGAYTGVEVDYPVSEVPDAQVEAQVTSRLQGQAALNEVSDRKKVEAGDFVLAELTITDADGEQVHAHPGTMINTSDERYYKGIESEIVGCSKGRSKKLQVSFADDAQIPELAGKTLTVATKVTSIQAMQTPELSDELAETLGYEGGAAGMRAAIRAQLQESSDNQARNQARANLLQVLIDANEFEAPRGLIDQQLRALLEEIRIQRAYRGEDPRKVQFTDAEIADYRNRATFAAKASLILDHVSAAEGISVTDADIEAKYQEIADARGQAVEAIKGYFQEEGAVDDLRARMLEEKTLDWLLERAELVSGGAAKKAAPAKKKAAPAKKKASGRLSMDAASEALRAILMENAVKAAEENDTVAKDEEKDLDAWQQQWATAIRKEGGKGTRVKVDALVERSYAEALKAWHVHNPPGEGQDSKWLAKDEIALIAKDSKALGELTNAARERALGGAAPAKEEASPAAGGEDLSGMSATALKALAKERGHKGYSKLKKDELVALLSG